MTSLGKILNQFFLLKKLYLRSLVLTGVSAELQRVRFLSPGLVCGLSDSRSNQVAWCSMSALLMKYVLIWCSQWGNWGLESGVAWFLLGWLTWTAFSEREDSRAFERSGKLSRSHSTALLLPQTCPAFRKRNCKHIFKDSKLLFPGC